MGGTTGYFPGGKGPHEAFIFMICNFLGCMHLHTVSFSFTFPALSGLNECNDWVE